MKAREANFKERVIGLAASLLPRALRSMDMRITMNAVGKSHNTPNNRRSPDTFSFVMVLLRASRIASGSTRMKPIIAAMTRSLLMLFIVVSPLYFAPNLHRVTEANVRLRES